MINTYYPSKSLKTMIDLSTTLDEDQNLLVKISKEVHKFYKKNPQIKADGTERMTYIVLKPLNRIQSKIKTRIFDRIQYGDHLFFGIKGKNGPKENAEFHCKNGKPKILINLDIEKFYPSINMMHIKNVWLNFFKFSEEISNLLTDLTMLSGELPQGAATSIALSNLIFYKEEKGLIRKIKSYGGIYSRYADDISITLHDKYSKQDLSEIIGYTISFLRRMGFKQNKEKFKISTESSPMIINNVTCINNNYLSLYKKKRKQARAKVNHAEDSLLTKKEFLSIRGYLNFCNSIQNHKDIKLLIKKISSQSDFLKT